MVSTLAFAEVVGRVFLLGFKVAFRRNDIDLRLHLLDLFMGQLCQSEVEPFLQLVFNKLGVPFRISHQIAVHDLVAGEFEQEQRALCVVSLISGGIQPILYLLGKFFIHISKFIVDVSKPNEIFAQRLEQSAHSRQCLPRCHKVIIDYDVRLFG